MGVRQEGIEVAPGAVRPAPNPRGSQRSRLVCAGDQSVIKRPMPRARSHIDQPMYASGTTGPTSFHPRGSKGPTNSNAEQKQRGEDEPNDGEHRVQYSDWMRGLTCARTAKSLRTE
jgi:hypothetical protein